MKRKNIFILTGVSVLSLSLIGGIVFTSNSSNLLRAKADAEYTITITTVSDSLIEGDTGIFELSGRNGSNTDDYLIGDCTVYNADESFTIGSNGHICSSSIEGYSYHYLQIVAVLKGPITSVTDYYLTGKINGSANNHIFNGSWLSYDSENEEYQVNIYLDNYSFGSLTSFEIDSIVFVYSCAQ